MITIKKRTVIGRIFFTLLISTMFLLPICACTEELFRSSSLHEMVTQNGNVVRKDYVDDNGNITFASNLHYATTIKTKAEQSVLEEYFDEKGNPAKQTLGYYAIRRDYDEFGRENKVTYLDAYGQPCINRYGYAIVTREYDENGKIGKDKYLDNNENPVKTSFLGYACIKEYDDSNRIIAMRYLDNNDDLVITAWGYAVVDYVYYESGPFAGKIKFEYYFDDNLLPISLTQGQFGIYHEYDEFGRSNLLTYLDADGGPVTTREGFTTVKRTFYPDDSVQTEFYYDKNGSPICLSEGQYGLLYTGNKKVYLDAEGNEIFNLKNFLYGNQTAVILFSLLAIVASLIINKRLNYVFIILYLFFILYMTLLHRNSGSVRYSFVPFRSYMQIFTNPETIWGIVNNVLLFVPLGAALYRIYPSNMILLTPLALSFIIEVCQLLMGVGYCELDDIINNELGALIGFYTAKLATGLLTRIHLLKHQNQ